jgi:Domain of unknown function (DUF1864)
MGAPLLSRDLPDYEDLWHVDAVRALDPLGADQACRRLPEMNVIGDVPVLVSTLRSLAPVSVAGFSPYECVAAMRDLGESLRDLEFALRLRSMIDSMNLVIKNVKPAFFARELRPYLEAVEVDGRPYLGPAAAQVPMWLVDELLWASDRNDCTRPSRAHRPQ